MTQRDEVAALQPLWPLRALRPSVRKSSALHLINHVSVPISLLQAVEHNTGSLELPSSLLLAPSGSVLFRTFFEFFFFFFFDRTLTANTSLCRCTGHFLRSTEPNWKRVMLMTEVPCKLTVKTRTIFLQLCPTTKAQMISKGEARGRHLDPEGGYANSFIPHFVKPKGLPGGPQHDDMNVLLVDLHGTCS